MLPAGKRQNGVTLGRWLLRGPSRREVLLTNAIRASAKVAGMKAKRHRR